MAGPRRGPHRAVDECRSITDVRVGGHASAQAVHHRRDGASRLPRARIVSAVDAVDRQGRQGHPLSDDLLELVSRPGRVSVTSHRRPINMRLHRIAASIAIVLMSEPAVAQGWTEFVSKDDRFTTNFPGVPQVRESTFTSQFGADLPSRVYSATRGESRFSVTVVDYRSIEKILTEKSKSCPEGAETCRGGSTPVSSTGAGYWKADLAGAMVYATWQFIRRDAVVTEFVWTNIDLVEGHLLHLTNKDKSRTYASIFMHENKLYIGEATVPAGDPEPGLFQQALGFIDENGRSIRYQTLYHNGFPTPPRSR